MKKLAELKNKLADLKADGIKLVDAAENEGREMTAEEQDRYDSIVANIEATNAEIAGIEKLAEQRRTMEAVVTTPGGGRNAVHDPNPETTGGFKSLGEFAHAVRNAQVSGNVDRRLFGAPTNVHEGGASSGEGYMVPSEFSDGIFEVVADLDEFGPLVDEEPTSKREVKSIADETTPWGSSGVQASWRSEGKQMSPSKLVTDPRSLPLHECYAFVLCTDELMEDAPLMQSRMTRKAGQAIAWKKNNAMVYGSGVGRPLGWMESNALVTVPKEGSQSADTLLAANVLKMYSRLLVLPGDSPFWLTNRDTIPQLATMTIGDKPIWMPPNGLMDAPGGMLMGYPVRFSEHAKTLGDLGDLQLISPKGYHALRREAGPKFAQSMHLYFDYAIEAFRWTFRFGGQPHLSAPVSPANGSATKSHFVALAERA